MIFFLFFDTMILCTHIGSIIDWAGLLDPHPMDCHLPTQEQLDLTILQLVIAILNFTRKHEENHLFGRVTTILIKVPCVPDLRHLLVKETPEWRRVSRSLSSIIFKTNT